MKPLPESETKNPKALDSIFEQMHAAYEKEKVPMTDDQTRSTLNIMMGSDIAINEIYEDIKKHYVPSGFFKRCELFPIKYEKRLLIWLFAVYIDFGIGGLILIAYYMQWRATKLNEQYVTHKNEIEQAGVLTLSLVCEKYFPFGVFSQQTAHEFWEIQKVKARPDNLIDHPLAAASFMPIERTEPITYKDH